jgi:tetratricopeptide (TPR) repeat protein
MADDHELARLMREVEYRKWALQSPNSIECGRPEARIAYFLAEREYAQARKLHVNIGNIHMELGAYAEALKEFHKALESFNKALSLDEGNEEAKEGLRTTISRINASQASGAVDPERARRAMEDPEIQAIMSDPMVNSALEDMQRDPAAMRRIMADQGLAAKIQKLIAAGVLRVG